MQKLETEYVEYILHSERQKIPVTNVPFATIEKKGTLDHSEIFLQKSTLDLMTAHWVVEDASLIWVKMLFNDFIFSFLKNGRGVML